jgi:signal transduction histidine kinase/CheY-like chemotaxis protein
MWNNLSESFLRIYRDSDFIVRHKSRTVLAISIAMVFMLLVLITTNIARNNSSFEVITPLVTALVAMFVSIYLLRAGYFNTAAHTALCACLFAVWCALFFDSNKDAIVVLDTVVYIPCLLVLTPIVVTRHKSVIIVYCLVNLAVAYAFTAYAARHFALSAYVVTDYLVDTSIVIVSVSIVTYQIFKINRKALLQAQEEIDKNLELNQSLETKVLERTEELRIANEKLKEMDRIKSNFFANISHEIRTPLTLILAPIESALQSESDAALNRDLLRTMERNAVRLLKLVNNLLDISKIEAGRVTMTVAEQDIIAFIQTYIDSIHLPSASRSISLSSDSTGPINLFFDAEKMDKVFMNLFSNALKFTGPGGSITIRVRDERNTCRVDFEDNGVGIPGEKIGIIFDRFSQANVGATRTHDGTGIGLSLVKEFIEMHGGTVGVGSRYIGDHPDSHGTVFTLMLPKGAAHLAGLSWVQFAGPGEETQVKRRKNRASEIRSMVGDEEEQWLPASAPGPPRAAPSILIVEDNPDMRKFLTSLLERHYTVRCATNGMEGLAMARELAPSLIITDVMMPIMSGYEMTGTIRQDAALRHIPIIMLTARTEIVEEHAGRETGADDFLIKPFSLKELMARIDALLKRGKR